MKPKYITAFAVLMMGMTACLPIGSVQIGIEPTPTAAKPVPEIVITQEPTPEPTQVVTETPAGPGTVSGKICFPSEFIPEMTAYFQNTETGEHSLMAIAQNQSTYSTDLAAGEYVLFAYLNDQSQMGGSYSEMVVCGLNANCTDHTLTPFRVQAGETTVNVDLCDWYAPESVPPNPKASEPGERSLTGLIYRSLTAGNIWKVGPDGTGHPLVNQWEAVVSPDGTQALFVQDADIWRIDLPTGIMRNISNTPDREELAPQWWPGNPNIAIFNSIDFGEEKGLSSGYATTANLDGTGYRVISDELSITLPSPAIDGRTLAFESGGSAWLFTEESGKAAFDPAAYGLSGVLGMVSPSWSPDGSKLSWWVQRTVEGGTEIALVVFELDSKSHTLLHAYSPIGSDGVNMPPVWSADGQWLAAFLFGDGARGGLWVFPSTGGDSINLGNAAQPVWSPTSSTLVFVQWPENGGPAQEATVKMVEAGEWTIRDTPLLPGSITLAWIIE